MGWDGMGEEVVTLQLGPMSPTGSEADGKPMERPKMWDVYSGSTGKLNTSLEKSMPLSVGFIPPPTYRPRPPSPLPVPDMTNPFSEIHYTDYDAWLDTKLKKSKRKKAPGPSGHLRVSVLLSLPSSDPPRYPQPHPSDGATLDESKSVSPWNDYDYKATGHTNLHLGVLDVPWTKQYDDDSF